jgi:hypothetical protein
MSQQRAIFGVLLFVISAGFFSCATAAVNSRDNACAILKGLALRDHLVAKNVPPGEYTCEDYSESGDYYVFGLHYKLFKPSDKPQSNLVGWFAVSKKDGSVYEWDMANLSLGHLVKDDH